MRLNKTGVGIEKSVMAELKKMKNRVGNSSTKQLTLKKILWLGLLGERSYTTSVTMLSKHLKAVLILSVMDTLLKSGRVQHVKFCRNGCLRGLRGWYQAHSNVELMQTTICRQNGPQWPRQCLGMTYRDKSVSIPSSCITGLVICNKNAG